MKMALVKMASKRRNLEETPFIWKRQIQKMVIVLWNDNAYMETAEMIHA